MRADLYLSACICVHPRLHFEQLRRCGSTLMSVPAIEIPREYNGAADFLDRNLVHDRADRIALRYGGHTFTYAQVAELVNRTGNSLRELGAEIENRVALVLPDSPDFVASFF